MIFPVVGTFANRNHLVEIFVTGFTSVEKFVTGFNPVENFFLTGTVKQGV